MKAASVVVVATTLALILALFLYVDPAEAAPKRRGGGGGSRRGSSSSSSGSSWFGGSKKKNNYGSSGSYGGSNYGTKKKGIGSKLKKAAVVGVGVYAGYQLGKLSAGYSSWGWGRSHGYGFNDWNRWREVDGFMCRKTEDCSWVDPRLYCQDYELDFSPSRAWFGGDFAAIVGECACPHGMVFNDREMRCQSRGYFSGLSGTGLILAILIPLGVLMCCCCAGVYIVKKFFQ